MFDLSTPVQAAAHLLSKQHCACMAMVVGLLRCSHQYQWLTCMTPGGQLLSASHFQQHSPVITFVFAQLLRHDAGALMWRSEYRQLHLLGPVIPLSMVVTTWIKAGHCPGLQKHIQLPTKSSSQMSVHRGDCGREVLPPGAHAVLGMM